MIHIGRKKGMLHIFAFILTFCREQYVLVTGGHNCPYYIGHKKYIRVK